MNCNNNEILQQVNIDNLLSDYEKILSYFQYLNNRKDIISYYKSYSKKINSDDFNRAIYKAGYDFNNNQWKFSSFREGIVYKFRNACLKCLKKLESFTPYKNLAYSKLKEYLNYLGQPPDNEEFEWDFYYQNKPSIHREATVSLNLKIQKNEPINAYDYFFIVKKKKITQFGYDYVFDIIDIFETLLLKKYGKIESLIKKCYDRFYNKSNYYSLLERDTIGYIIQAFKRNRSLFIRFNNAKNNIPDIYKNVINDKLMIEGHFFRFDRYITEKKDIEYISRILKIKGVSFCDVVSINNNLNKLLREAENILRKNMNLPKINEGWISETKLYNKIKKYFKPLKVIHHARLSFLGKQHFDILIPYHKISIEYQGKQHYEPVEYFGDEDAFNKRKQLYRKKMELSKDNHIKLFYVDEGYNIDDVIKII